MKNIKKLALLFAIVTVFVINCQNAPKTLNATFNIVTDNETSIPRNQPNIVDNKKEFPKDFTITPTIFVNTEIVNSISGQSYEVRIKKGNTITTYSTQTQASFLSYTSGVVNPEGVLSSIELVPAYEFKPSAEKGDHYRLKVNRTMFNALGAKGQAAKIKLDVYINGTDDSNTAFNTGVETLYVNVKRIR